ncbi:hypothetical protein H2199_008973 [Coniosporium tulheliwenetii]|uniref:Uncharacterized protein n=1 Tax=Coniosporium tulheliwenetii TaxID=3383036 RepID=A0ACC2YHA5_9PEZI|nr:hypothetical protein H2199_008973 [Cladosporium sp. JES 115]
MGPPPAPLRTPGSSGTASVFSPAALVAASEVAQSEELQVALRTADIEISEDTNYDHIDVDEVVNTGGTLLNLVPGDNFASFIGINPATPAYREMLQEDGGDLAFQRAWDYCREYVDRINGRKERYLKVINAVPPIKELWASSADDEVIRALNHRTYKRSLKTNSREATSKNFTVTELRTVRATLKNDDEPLRHSSTRNGPPERLLNTTREASSHPRATSSSKRGVSPSAEDSPKKRLLRSVTGKLPPKKQEPPPKFRFTEGTTRRKKGAKESPKTKQKGAAGNQRGDNAEENEILALGADPKDTAAAQLIQLAANRCPALLPSLVSNEGDEAISGINTEEEMEVDREPVMPIKREP